MIVEILLSFGLYKIKVYFTQKNKPIRIRDTRQKQDQDLSVQDKATNTELWSRNVGRMVALQVALKGTSFQCKTKTKTTNVTLDSPLQKHGESINARPILTLQAQDLPTD